MPTDNVAIVRRMIEGLNQGRFAEVVADYLTPDYVRHDLAGAFERVRGHDGASEFVRRVYAAVPDLRVEVVDAFGTGDRVAARVVYRGTLRGTLFGAEPTGEQIEVQGVNLYRLRDGRIAESWQLLDLWGFMAQAGEVDPPR